MLDEKHDFELSVGELEYLNQLASGDQSLADLLKSEDGARGDKATIRLSPAEAEQLRDYLTTRLATVGFDESYAPNEQGQILERLIDRFFLC